MTRKQRVTRFVYGVFIVLVAAFVVWSTTQVGIDVFGSPKTADRSPKVGAECEAALQREIKAIDEARVAASVEPNADAAKARYASSRQLKDGKGAGETCASDPNGQEALAALARFDRAAEAHAARNAQELSPVRLDVQSFIRSLGR